jgi:hypothetical protein
MLMAAKPKPKAKAKKKVVVVHVDGPEPDPLEVGETTVGFLQGGATQVVATTSEEDQGVDLTATF